MAKDRPIKVFIQVIKIFFYCAATIIVISILIDRDPVALLAGTGSHLRRPHAGIQGFYSRVRGRNTVNLQPYGKHRGLDCHAQ